MHISIRNLNKSFAEKHVLKNFSLDIEKQKSTVIIGASGSGKSVTLKCLIGLLKPDSGDIFIDGKKQNLTQKNQQNNQYDTFGMLFQGGALFDSLSIWENIAFALINSGHIERKKAKKIATEKLQLVGLDENIIELFPAELSGGMQKRVALARAIAAEPKIILLDEPTTGLDPITADAINNLINESVKRLGATAISITHDMASVRKIADNVAMIHEGKIIWNGSIKNIDKSKNPYVDQFINGRAQGPIKMPIRKN